MERQNEKKRLEDQTKRKSKDKKFTNNTQQRETHCQRINKKEYYTKDIQSKCL